MPNELKRANVDHIPVVWIEPPDGATRELALWLPGFSGTKEAVEPQLRDLAAAGFVAVSYDPWQHGERLMETRDELVARVRGNIRRHFWPILTLTAEEAPRIIDWATETLHAGVHVRMGGISMGGDISVAAAGVDKRIVSVAACIATPDWMRPGSFEPPEDPTPMPRMAMTDVIRLPTSNGTRTVRQSHSSAARTTSRFPRTGRHASSRH